MEGRGDVQGRGDAGQCAPLAGSFRQVPSLGHPNFLSDTVDWLHTDMRCMKVGAAQLSQCAESLSVTPGPVGTETLIPALGTDRNCS